MTFGFSFSITQILERRTKSPAISQLRCAPRSGNARISPHHFDAIAAANEKSRFAISQLIALG